MWYYVQKLLLSWYRDARKDSAVYIGCNPTLPFIWAGSFFVGGIYDF